MKEFHIPRHNPQDFTELVRSVLKGKELVKIAKVENTGNELVITFDRF